MSRPKGLEMEQQCLAETIERVRARVQHLILDDPRGNIAGPLLLVERQVELPHPPATALLNSLDILYGHL